MKTLDVRVDNLSREEIIDKIREFLDDKESSMSDSQNSSHYSSHYFHQIATINPEIILAAQEDEKYKNILNACNLNVADGFGLNLAFWKNGEKLKCRFAGADLMEEILEMAAGKGMKIFLAARKDGLSSWEETRDAILKKYPALEIEGENISKETISYQLKTASSDVVFCNFGAPYQEKFLSSLKDQENGKIKLAIGVGGSFDYLTGKVRRAPLWMRQFGLEWLWRLILEPRYRFKRIWKAVVVFPYKILF